MPICTFLLGEIPRESIRMRRIPTVSYIARVSVRLGGASKDVHVRVFSFLSVLASTEAPQRIYYHFLGIDLQRSMRYQRGISLILIVRSPEGIINKLGGCGGHRESHEGCLTLPPRKLCTPRTPLMSEIFYVSKPYKRLNL